MPSVAMQMKKNDQAAVVSRRRRRCTAGSRAGWTSTKLAVGVLKSQTAMFSFVAHRARTPVGIEAPGR